MKKEHCEHDKHKPVFTGRSVWGVFGKDNLPAGTSCAKSYGPEALCAVCGARLIYHLPELKMTDVATVLLEQVA